MARACKGQKVRNAWIDIIILDDKSIRRMNRDFLDHDYATDVITFPLEDIPLTGEIYISLDTARKQADDYGVTLVNELSRLAVHGALHLMGHDDATDEDRAGMHKLENRYINGRT
ncbi:MAG: rRNA maturation RNase YbeY [Candidatus Kapaibacterium thiocyanatum]|uniref:Endoribonuclease YbeY n=1 Tax=Candidatus Kapaibacterium thiocyanatum TaxID=1895771 RepID=A0A1M3L712_9BACT|nr:MAG: rRNA maturation RNase YbeY ['Candidatus Kapabacteria' thiocyanatum]